MPRQHRIEFSLRIHSEAGPTRLTGMLHHAGSRRVHFDIAHTGWQIGLAVYQTGFVSPLPKASRSSVRRVNVTDKRSAGILHRMGETVGCLGREQ
jgi:hypothetical protein